jgi:hypothetical protein
MTEDKGGGPWEMRVVQTPEGESSEARGHLKKEKSFFIDVFLGSVNHREEGQHGGDRNQ